MRTFKVRQYSLGSKAGEWSPLGIQTQFTQKVYGTFQIRLCHWKEHRFPHRFIYRKMFRHEKKFELGSWEDQKKKNVYSEYDIF